jgi:hypothetical protein
VEQGFGEATSTEKCNQQPCPVITTPAAVQEAQTTNNRV